MSLHLHFGWHIMKFPKFSAKYHKDRKILQCLPALSWVQLGTCGTYKVIHFLPHFLNLILFVLPSSIRFRYYTSPTGRKLRSLVEIDRYATLISSKLPWMPFFMHWALDFFPWIALWKVATSWILDVELTQQILFYL